MLPKKKEQQATRRRRIRGKIKGTAQRPRLAVFRSNKYIYAQIINDDQGKTLASVSEKELKKEDLGKGEKAKALGELLAQKAATAKIKKVVFDRAGYRYHGRVKALAEGARKGGLEF